IRAAILSELQIVCRGFQTLVQQVRHRKITRSWIENFASSLCTQLRLAPRLQAFPLLNASLGRSSASTLRTTNSLPACSSTPRLNVNRMITVTTNHRGPEWHMTLLHSNQTADSGNAVLGRDTPMASEDRSSSDAPCQPIASRKNPQLPAQIRFVNHTYDE